MKYYLVFQNDDCCFPIETDEKTFHAAVDKISESYEIQKDNEIDHSTRYFRFDCITYKLIGYTTEG